MSNRKICRNCKWWCGVAETGKIGTCLFPVAKVLPAWIGYEADSTMYWDNGASCQCFEKRKE